MNLRRHASSRISGSDTNAVVVDRFELASMVSPANGKSGTPHSVERPAPVKIVMRGGIRQMRRDNVPRGHRAERGQKQGTAPGNDRFAESRHRDRQCDAGADAG